MAASIVSIKSRPWGISPDGNATRIFTVANDTLRLELLSFGARLTSLHAPDCYGNQSDVVLGFSALQPYVEDTAFLGCTVGRYANRIAQGRFSVEGRHYELERNDGSNTLHGGPDGLWHRNWEGRELADGVEFTLNSGDGDQGFPGAVAVTARYRLDGNKVRLEYEALTDKATVLNLTNHAYFNLAGEGSATILDHVLQIEADDFTPIDGVAIPLGGSTSVAGTPFDFIKPREIGDRIRDTHEQLLNGHGYDHNFVLREHDGELKLAATAMHNGTGRKLEVETTEPGVQFYSGNYLDGTRIGKSGRPYHRRSAFCLETQHFPDSPNRPDFPSTVLRPGEMFRSTTVWTLSAS